MLAVDTNVIVRFLTRDDERQASLAREVVEGAEVFVSLTVLLETEWVLRSAYRFDVASVAGALRGFCGLPRVRVEAAMVAAKAIDWMEFGLDFGDALHLAKAAACEAFVTFDRRIATRRPAGAVAVRVL